MTPNPKKKRIKLNPKEYHELRRKVYDSQLGCCKRCKISVYFEKFHLHHKISRGAGGDDQWSENPEESNLIGLCWECHRKVHDGNIRFAGTSNAHRESV